MTPHADNKNARRTAEEFRLHQHRARGRDAWCAVLGVCAVTALTDFQFAEIQRAAALLPDHAHAAFVKSVANRLAEIEQCSDHDVNDAITFVLSVHGVAAAPAKST